VQDVQVVMIKITVLNLTFLLFLDMCPLHSRNYYGDIHTINVCKPIITSMVIVQNFDVI